MKIENKIMDTIKKYKLFTKKDKLLVASSGGKDSTALLYILKKYGYNIHAIYVDAGIPEFTDASKKNLDLVCQKYKIPFNSLSLEKEFDITLPEILTKLKLRDIKYKSCTACGILRRYLINKYARENKFNRVVTGHNLDDEAQATLMNIFRNDIERFKRQGPWVGSVNSKHFVPRVKPLYFITEEELLNFSNKMKFPVDNLKCPFSSGVYRDYIKKYLYSFEAKRNIVNFTIKKLNGLKKIDTEISVCKICGEPSNSEICKTCQIIMAVGGKNASISG
jgi:uncharacterized protein (TIGR00269 family)